MSEDDVAAIIATLDGAGGPDEGVWPQNATIVEAFLAASSQWRTAPIGGGPGPVGIMFIGLDYAGARAGIEASGIPVTPELWAGLRVMEAEARDALNGVRG